MSRNWIEEINYSRTKSHQFVVTYKDSSTLVSLSELGSITYKSPVINVLFIDTVYSKDRLLEVDGVMSVTVPKNGRLLNNKEKSTY
ncbi:hypothetical protein ACQKNX_07680 [Lysinibacillus sp. NPDC093712]|uniref:hypothetical protein n=1 Tax=Lysinibacillus sp. NPDC093712 TaxID=3390579 RepID=UPI003D0516BC